MFKFISLIYSDILDRVSMATLLKNARRKLPSWFARAGLPKLLDFAFYSEGQNGSLVCCVTPRWRGSYCGDFVMGKTPAIWYKYKNLQKIGIILVHLHNKYNMSGL